MKPFKRILLAILSLPFLVAMILVNLLWFPIVAVVIPFIILFEWLKDDVVCWDNDWWNIFIIPVGLYFDSVWDIDFI